MKHNSKLNRSRWLLLTLFTLIVGISPAWGDTLTEDFESLTVDGTTLSNGWFVQGTNGYGAAYLLNPSVINNFSDAYNYSYELCKQGRSGRSIVTSKASNPAYIVIPVELTGTVRFYAASYKTSNGSCNVFEVTEDGGVYTIGSTSLTGGAVSLPKKSSSSASPTWQEISVELGSEHKMIAITMTYGALDDFVGEKYVYTPYQAPASISVVPSETSAIITWTASATEETVTAWNLEYKKSSDDVWSEVHGIAAGTLSQEISGLNDNTNYDVRVKAIYGTEESVWKTTTFKTPRAPITSFPWSEDFTGLTSGNIPDGWDNTEGTTITASYKWTYYSSGNTAAPCLRFNSYNNYTDNTNFLKTPVMSYTQNAPMQLKFWYKNPKGGDFSVFISNDGGATYTRSLATGLTGASEWTEKVIDLPTDEYYNNVVIVFKGTSNYGSGDAYIYLDDVLVKENASYAMSISGEDVSENTIAFGEVKNTSTTKTFTISNDGANDLTAVSVISSDAEVFTVSDTDFDIAAGGTKDITVTFVKGVVGSYKETITVSQANVASPIVLSVTGSYATPSAAEMVVKDGEEVIGETVAFGNVGKTKSKTITITNTGEADLNITSITSSNTTDFTVSPSALTVHGGSSETFTVTFVYDAEALDDEKTATITVTASNEGIEAKSFTVTGTRIEQWSEDFSGGTLPDGWIADTNYWTFADGVVKGKYNTWNRNNYLFTPLLIVNDASESLTFNYATTAGSVSIPIYYSKDGGEYTAYPGTPTSLANGVSGTFTITGLEAGNYVFRFGNDDYNLDNFEGFKLNADAPILGYYTNPTCTVAASSTESKTFDFVTETPNAQVYYIKNDGTGTMSISLGDIPTGFTAELGKVSLTAGESTTMSINMSEAIKGYHSGNIVLTAKNSSDESIGTFTVAASGVVVDENKLYLDFSSNNIPYTWTNPNTYWTKNNNGYIETGYNSGTLVSSSLSAEAGEAIVVEALHKYSGYSFTVKYRKVGDDDWTDLISETSMGTNYKLLKGVIEEAGTYELQFAGSYVQIRHFYGLSEPSEPVMVVYDNEKVAGSTHNFGNVSDEADATWTLTVKNEGKATLTGLAAALSGENADHYSVEVSATELAVDATATITVKQLKDNLGSHEATLTISADDPITDKVIALSGSTHDHTKLYLDFEDGNFPATWTNAATNTWTINTQQGNKYLRQYRTATSAIMTSALTIADDEVLKFDAKSEYSDATLTVRYTTNGGITWTEYATYTYNNGLTGTFDTKTISGIPAGTVMLQFDGMDVGIDNVYGFTPTTAPILSLTESAVTVANGSTKEFGNLTEAGTAIYTLSNTGTANLVSTVATTGVATAAITGEGEGVTISENTVTLEPGKSATITLTVPFAAPYGEKAGAMTISSEGWVANMVVNYTATTIDPTALYIDFSNNAKPEGWYHNGWSFSNGQADVKWIANKVLMTQLLTVSGTEDALRFEVKAYNPESFTPVLKVEYSTDRKTWTEFDNQPSGMTSEGFTPYEVKGLAAGNYYVRFTGSFVYLDNISGWHKVTGIEHDLYVSATTFPATTLIPETVDGVNATATVYSLRANETGVYAKLFFDETEVATAEAQNISKDGSANFTLTGNVPATEKTYAAKIVVYYSNDEVAFETLTTDVEVAHTRTLSITEFTRDGEGEIDANASNQFSAAFNVTVQNTGSTAATPVVKIFIGETEVGSATADAEIAAGKSKEIAVNVTNASAGEGGNLAFTAKAYWTAEGEVKATSASDVIIKVNAAAPKFVLNIKGGAEVSDGDNVEFGLVKEATTKTYTITNSGTAPLELISIVAPTGYTATEVTAGNKTIAIDGTLDIDVTLNAEQGKKSGNLVFTYKVDAMTNNTFTLALSGRSVAADTWTEAFDDYQASIPANWTNNKWSIAGEYNDYPGAVYSYNDDATLISPRLTAEAGEELTFDVKNNYYNTATYAIFSASSNTWSDEETISGTGEITFTAPAAGDYYLRLTGRGAYIQNFVGFKLATTVPVTISQYGYTTFASMSNINADELPDGIEVFYVKSEGVDGSYVRLTKAEGNIPAGTGLILKGTANTEYNLNIATGTTTALEDNLMVGCLENTKLGVDASSYVLVNNAEEERAEFQRLDKQGIEIPAGKAYLKVAGAGARLMIFDDGETTGISSVLRQQARDGRVYNLNGQRVENPKKDQLYIINGKQTVVK